MDMPAAAAAFRTALEQHAGGIQLYIEDVAMEGDVVRFLLPQKASVLMKAEQLRDYLQAPETEKRTILNTWIARFSVAFVGPAAHSRFSR